MGNCLLAPFRRERPSRRHISLVLLGVNREGSPREDEDSITPSVMFKAVNVLRRRSPITIYDLSDRAEFRLVWSQYYGEVHGLIFVIAKSDPLHLQTCKTTLESVLSDDKVAGKPVVVLVNGVIRRADKIKLETLITRFNCPHIIEQCGESKTKRSMFHPGVKRSYYWLLKYIENNYGVINDRVLKDRQERRQERDSDCHMLETGFPNPNYRSLPREDETGDVSEPKDDKIQIGRNPSVYQELKRKLAERYWDAEEKSGPEGTSGETAKDSKTEVDEKRESDALKRRSDQGSGEMGENGKAKGEEGGKSSKSSPEHSERAASATQLVRNQLQLLPDHRRRFTLRYGSKKILDAFRLEPTSVTLSRLTMDDNQSKNVKKREFTL